MSPTNRSPRLSPNRRLKRRWLPLACGLAATSAAAVVAVAACGADAPPAGGQGSPTAVRDGDQAVVDRLIRRLGAGSIVARDAAERALVELGPAALPRVTAARRHAAAAAALPLERIERVLQRDAAARAIEPAVVTLAAEDTAAAAVLADLFSQTGSRIAVAAAADRRISVRCDRLTFWEALDDVLDRAGLALEFGTAAGTQQLRIVDAMPGVVQPPAVAAGPIHVSVAGIERTGPATGADAWKRPARITLRVAWEPRFEPLLARLPARSLIAEGPGGESVPAAQRGAVIEATASRERSWIDLPVLFAAPAVPLERLGMLRGTVVLWLTGMEHAFCFEGVRAGREPTDSPLAAPLRVGQAEVRLLDARIAEGRLLARASVTYDDVSEALASHRSWLAARRLVARGADGVPLECLDQRIEARTDRGATVAAEFQPPAGNATAPELCIRWTLPIAVHELPIDFAVRDVPLPAPSAR